MGTGENRHSPAKVRAFQEELSEWMGKNNLLEGTQWRTADEHYLRQSGAQVLLDFRNHDFMDGSRHR